jgi:proline dehydrogenase
VSIQQWAFPLARRFVAGESLDDALIAVRSLNDAGLTATLDLLGEDVHQSADADRTRNDHLALIERLAASGVDTNLSIKLSALGLAFEPEAALARLDAILAAAATALRDPFVRVDMEGSALVTMTLDVVTRAFAHHASTGTVLQAYLHRTPADVARLIALGMRVRLCKGAYKEPESIALQEMHAIRVQYLALAMQLLAGGAYPAIATHDPLLIEAVKQVARDRDVARDAFEFQLLYGVRPELQRALAAEGYRVRIYVPFGTQWAKYFRRRVTERRENLIFALRSLVGA